MVEKENLILSFSDSDALDSERGRLIEEIKEEGCYSEDLDSELEKRLNNADLSFYWEDFKSNFYSEVLKQGKNKFWSCSAKNLDWLHREGSKFFEANKTEDFLEAILPKTNEFSIKVFKQKRNLFLVKVYHHDCPTGTLLYCRSISEKEFDKGLRA